MRNVAIIIMLLLNVNGANADSIKSSYYYQGQHTASGERFNPHGLTAAHRTLPFGTLLKVCYHGCVVVRINDRGPFTKGRGLDLSLGAAKVIGMIGVGVANVRISIQ